MDVLWEDLQRIWEEEEKERERDRIRALIQSYMNKQSEAYSLISSAEAYLNDYDSWMEKIITAYEVDNSIIRGQIATEYNRVYELAWEKKSIITSNYNTMISDAVSLTGKIQEKINELTIALNNV